MSPLSASVSSAFSVNSLEFWLAIISSALEPESTLVYKSTKEGINYLVLVALEKKLSFSHDKLERIHAEIKNKVTLQLQNLVSIH